jgi:hypothetical protein
MRRLPNELIDAYEADRAALVAAETAPAEKPARKRAPRRKSAKSHDAQCVHRWASGRGGAGRPASGPPRPDGSYGEVSCPGWYRGWAEDCLVMLAAEQTHSMPQTDEKDAVLIARLTAHSLLYPRTSRRGLGQAAPSRCPPRAAARRHSQPDPADACPARIRLARGPGHRRQPFRSRIWAAAISVICDRDHDELTRTPPLGPARFEQGRPPRDHPPWRPETIPADRAQSVRSARGPSRCDRPPRRRAGPGAPVAGRLVREPASTVRHRGPHARCSRRAAADRSGHSIVRLSAIGAAAILAETGDLTRFTSARAVVKHAGPAPARRPPESSPGGPNSPARAVPVCAWPRGARSGAPSAPTRSTPPATSTCPAVQTTSSPRPRRKPRSPRASCPPARRGHHRPLERDGHRADGRGEPHAALRNLVISKLIMGSPVRRRPSRLHAAGITP